MLTNTCNRRRRVCLGIRCKHTSCFWVCQEEKRGSCGEDAVLCAAWCGVGWTYDRAVRRLTHRGYKESSQEDSVKPCLRFSLPCFAPRHTRQTHGGQAHGGQASRPFDFAQGMLCVGNNHSMLATSSSPRKPPPRPSAAMPRRASSPRRCVRGTPCRTGQAPLCTIRTTAQGAGRNSTRCR